MIEKKSLAGRLMHNVYFNICWFSLIALTFVFVSWPIRNIALVCWVYGTDGYFQHGIRVLRGKPIKFSTGELAPALPDFVTFSGAVIITVFGLTVLLIFALRFYERRMKEP